MNALIIDDEEHARITLKNLCALCCPEITTLSEATTVEEAIYHIKQYQPNLIFLDINLGKGNGFEVLEALEHLSLNVIFVTAHDEYGIRALKASAVDYLLKPLKSTELIKAVQKVQLRLEKHQQSSHLGTLLLNLNQQNHDIQRLVIKTLDIIHIINVSEIVFCQSDKGYTIFQLIENRTIISSKTLSDYENMLPSNTFMRIHQSYLVNLHHVVRYHKKDKNTLTTFEGYELPVALRRKEQLMEFLNKITH